DHACCASAVLHNNRLTELGRKAFTHETSHPVHSAPGSNRHNDGDWFAGIVCRCNCRSRKEPSQDRREEASFHFLSPNNLMFYCCRLKAVELGCIERE